MKIGSSTVGEAVGFPRDANSVPYRVFADGLCKVVVALVGVICFGLTNAAGMTDEAMDAYMQAHLANEFTTQDVIRLVELKVDSDLIVKEIAQRVSKNVDLTFSASDADLDRIKRAGASNDLIEAVRSPISAVRFAREHPANLPHPVQFKSEEGDYSLDYPDQPEKKDWAVGNAHGSLYIAVLANVIYMSAYSVYNQDVDADRELEATTTSFAKEINAKVTERKRTRFVRAPGDELSALECTVESDKALGRCLSVVDGRRFYIVSGLSVKPQNGEAAIDLFLKSFKLASSAAGASSTTSQPTAQASTSSSPGDQNPASGEPSLVSLSAGAFPVRKPTEAYGSSVLELMDELPVSHWRSASGVTDPQVFVMELPDKTVLKTVEFDCTYDLFEHEGVCAKDVSVEISDTSEADGYRKIADVSLKEGADNQKFPVSSEIPGRWIRLTVKNNHGSKDFIQLNDFRATGTQLIHTPLPNISGTYSTGPWGDLHLKQEGTSVTGCYTYLGRSDNTVEGGIDGRVVKINYCTYCSDPGRSRGPAFLVFSADGKRFIGLYWYESSSLNAYGGLHLEGNKISSEVGTCPQWAGSAKSTSAVENQLTKDLEEFGRARVYGINFDSDSDHIKDESKPTLDKIVSMLKAKADWKMTIEGHTDSTSTPQHNQGLSERRAASVKNYLTTAGIDGSRLTTVGYGQSKPVADNGSPIGRSQNRRVELIKQ